VDLVVSLVGGDRPGESGFLFVGESLAAAAQDRPDPVQRVAFAAAVSVDLLLDAAADLVDGVGAKFHDMEGVEDGDSIVELVVMAFL
jgi:hypothetical protein